MIETPYKRIADLPTPASMVDLGAVRRNAQRMKAVKDRVNGERSTYANGDKRPVSLLPHSKTAAGVQDILEIQANPDTGSADGFLASKVREGELLWALGYRKNIFFAFPHLGRQNLGRIRDLVLLAEKTRESVISLLVAHREGISYVKEAFGNGPYPDIYVAIDTGGGREGRQLDDPEEAFTTVKVAHEVFGDKFQGVNTYNGAAYGKRNPDSQVKAMRDERNKISAFVRECEQKYCVPIKEVGYGSTPTAIRYEGVAGSRVTQLHPGIFILGDNATRSLGVIPQADCAITVLTRVIDKKTVIRKRNGKREKIGRVLLDAGSKFLSSDHGPHGEGDSTSYGAVFNDFEEGPINDSMKLIKLSEEIGWMEVPPEDLNEPRFKINAKIRILVAHACPALAEARDRLFFVDGKMVQGRGIALAQGYEQFPLDEKFDTTLWFGGQPQQYSVPIVNSDEERPTLPPPAPVDETAPPPPVAEEATSAAPVQPQEGDASETASPSTE